MADIISREEAHMQALAELERRSTDKFATKADLARFEAESKAVQSRLEKALDEVHSTVNSLEVAQGVMSYKLDAVISWLTRIFWVIATPILAWGGYQIIEVVISASRPLP